MREILVVTSAYVRPSVQTLVEGEGSTKATRPWGGECHLLKESFFNSLIFRKTTVRTVLNLRKIAKKLVEGEKLSFEPKFVFQDFLFLEFYCELGRHIALVHSMRHCSIRSGVSVFFFSCSFSATVRTHFPTEKHPCLSQQLRNLRNIESSRSTYRLNSQHLAAVPTSNIGEIVPSGFYCPQPLILRRSKHIFPG